MRMLAAQRLTLLFIVCSFLTCCTSSTSSHDGSSGDSEQTACKEPENPYSYGSAEYKGYEWAEEHGRSCSASSTEFTEGCEEYDNQEAEYEECQAKKN